jgi:hypothetical protein
MIKYVSLCHMVQSVDVVKYTDEEYEKYLTDPVGINLCIFLIYFNCIERREYE